MKYTDTKIVFQEIPDEISLAINISNCPFKCPGCHSPELQENIGNNLNSKVLFDLIENNKGITCVLFMGGSPKQIENFASFIKNRSGWQKDYENLKVAWYTGLEEFPDIDLIAFDYIKLGPYIQELGPINNPNTNQKLFKMSRTIEGDTIAINITHKFWKNV